MRSVLRSHLYRAGGLWAGLACALLCAPAVAQPQPFGDEIQVNAYTTDLQAEPVVAVAPDGSFVVAWESYGQDGEAYGSFLRRFDSAGGALTGDIQIATSTTFDQVDPDVAMFDDGSFVVVWDADYVDGSYRGIFGRLFDSAGSPVGGVFPINQGTVGDQNDAVVAPAADGGFVVVWETNALLDPAEELVARRFDSAGDPVGDDYQINIFTTGDQEDADIAVDGAGNFVVVWESEAQDGSYDGVFGRRLDSVGQPMGGEFAVNTYIPGDQDNPSLAVRADGTFVVVWEDDTQGGEDGIWARFFDSAGVATTTPFQVETTAGYQFLPKAAFDDEGRAVFAWEGSEAESLLNADVYVRTFDEDGLPVTGEFVVPLEVDGNQYLPALGINSAGDGVVAWLSDLTDPGEVVARRLGDQIFTDGFESGDTTGWSAVFE